MSCRLDKAFLLILVCAIFVSPASSQFSDVFEGISFLDADVRAERVDKLSVERPNVKSLTKDEVDLRVRAPDEVDSVKYSIDGGTLKEMERSSGDAFEATTSSLPEGHHSVIFYGIGKDETQRISKDFNIVDLSTQSSSERYIVGLKEGAEINEIKSMSGESKEVIKVGSRRNAVKGSFNSAQIESLSERDDVDFIEKDKLGQATVHNQGGQTVPWGVEKIQADDLIHENNSGEGVDVAVVDTGIDSDHEDLEDNIGKGNAVTACGTCDEPWGDDNGHGTHVAGTIAAVNNNEDVIGVSPDVRLHSVKVLGANGIGYYSDMAEGIRWATDQNYDIVSMSIGGTSSSHTLRSAIEYAKENGVLVVLAAGNQGCEDCVLFPGRMPETFTVGSTNSNDELSYFSSYGDPIDLVAPGERILSTVPGATRYYSGTSMATPHVSGTAAQVMAKDPGISASQVEERLKSTALDIGYSKNKQGAGRLNSEEAVGAEENSSSNHVLRIKGEDPVRSNYFIEVESSLSESDDYLESNDNIEGDSAQGRVQPGGQDKYSFRGDLVGYSDDGEVSVFLDGEKIEPDDEVNQTTVTFQGMISGKIEYSFGADGAEKSDLLRASINNGDSVSDTSVDGSLWLGRDSYMIPGGLKNIETDGSIAVFVDGRNVFLNRRDFEVNTVNYTKVNSSSVRLNGKLEGLGQNLHAESGFYYWKAGEKNKTVKETNVETMEQLREFSTEIHGLEGEYSFRAVAEKFNGDKALGEIKNFTIRANEEKEEPKIVGETGFTEVIESRGSNWDEVRLNHSYDKPLVFATIEGEYLREEPAHARVRNVENDSFEVIAEEWTNQDGVHEEAVINYLVVEKGVHKLDSGIIFEAMNTSTQHKFTKVDLSEDYSEPPLIFSQSQTFNGWNPIVTRQRNIGIDGFEVKVQEEEARGSHFEEEIAYLAVRTYTEPGSEARSSYRKIGDNEKIVEFSRKFDDPVLIANAQSANGGNTASVVIDSLKPRRAKMHVQEERSNDKEIYHLDETIGYMVFEQRRLLASSED